MTSDELDRLANAESKEFFVWLKGYMEGMRTRDADIFDVSAIGSAVTHLQERWRSLRERNI